MFDLLLFIIFYIMIFFSIIAGLQCSVNFYCQSNHGDPVTHTCMHSFFSHYYAVKMLSNAVLSITNITLWFKVCFV